MIDACLVRVAAIIDGAAFGGALELAIACDWRRASVDAKLGMPAIRLGVVYSPAGLACFVRATGASRAHQLALTGRPVGGQRAFEIGLVEEVVPAADLWTDETVAIAGHWRAPSHLPTSGGPFGPARKAQSPLARRAVKARRTSANQAITGLRLPRTSR